MNKLNNINNSKVLFLTQDEWFDDYSACKYQVVHLNICDRIKVSVIDVFVLAASRLAKGGELIVRFSACSPFVDLNAVASSFNFREMDISKNQTFQMVFRFEGQETKFGYQMQPALTVSEGCISLFKEVFGHEISNRFWNWKYPKDRQPYSIAALKGNQVIAHYGFCDRLAFYNDECFPFSQASDVMVAASSRGSISSSIFYELFLLVEKIFDSKSPKLSVAYGFPHGRHFKLGARLKLYSSISPIFEVVFDIPGASNNKQTVDSGKCSHELVSMGFEEKLKINAIIREMLSTPDTVILKRDYLYLLQRYIHHPEYKYKIYYIDGCYFVIKPMVDRVLLMDYFGILLEYADKVDILISHLSNIYPNKTLHLWCLEDVLTSFHTPKLVIDTKAVFVCKKYSSKLPEFKSWWISMGDTEFL